MVTAPADWAAEQVGEHWEVIAAVLVVGAGVVLVATGIGAAVGAGILIGAGSNLAVQVMRGGPIDARNVALSGVVGGASAGVGSMATTAASSAAPVAASSYAAAIPEVVGSTVGAFSNGVLTETLSERLDRNPLNDEVSTRDVLVETTSGFVFGGIRSTVPHGNEVLDLRLSDRELVGARHISEAGKSLSSDTVLALQGDGAEWPTGGPRP
jgi:hypothetical protein